MGTTPNLVETYKSVGASLGDGNSTNPKRVVVAGSDGARIHQMVLATNDGSSNTAKLYHLEQMTLQSAMGTGAHVDGGGSDDTLTRTTGSFLTDGWLVDDLLFVHASTTLANDYLARLTAVAATTLTFATATVNTAENLPSGAILYRATPIGVVATAANAGVASGTPSEDLLNPSELPEIDATPRRYRTLGSTNAIAVAMGSVLGASEYADITTFYADY